LFTRADRLDWRRRSARPSALEALVGLDLAADDVAGLVEMAVAAVGYAVGPFILARYLTCLPGLGMIAPRLPSRRWPYTAPQP